MKHIIFTIFILLIYCVGFSQRVNIQLSIFDSLTNEPLPFATVYLKNIGIGTTSDFSGQAQLNFNNEVPRTDTLVCSYIGYMNQKIPIDLTKSIKIKIPLPPSSTNLSEFVVTYKKPLTTKQILKKCIKNTVKNYSNTPVNLEGLYREILKDDNNYIYLNEAVVNIQYTKYPQNRLDHKIWEDWNYDDTYAFEFKGGWFSEFPTHFNTKQDKVKLIEARSSDNMSNNNFDSPISGGPLSLTGKDFIKYRYDFLNPNNFNKYTYTKKDNELTNNHDCYVLYFYPNETNKKMVFDMGKKMKRSIYVGRLYIDMESFAVVKMEYQLAKNVDFGFYKHHVPIDDRVTVSYQKNKSVWYLKKVSRSKIKSIKTKSNQKKLIYESIQELFITNVIKDSVVQFNESEIWKHTRLTSLRNREVSYNSKFWKENEKKYPKIPKHIRTDLEIEKLLEQQFKNRFKQKDNLPIPKVKEIDFSFNYSIENLSDNYQWLADSTNQTELFKYLEQENSFADNYIIPYKKYQKNYFNNLNNFYPKDTSNINNYYKKGTLIYDEDSLENTILYEYSDSLNRVPVFNLTRFQDYRKNCYITSIKPYNNKIGVSYTYNGGLNNYVIILNKGYLTVHDSISDVYSYAWFNDSTLLYTKNNTTKRSDKLYRHNLISKKDSLMLFEKDVTYDISLSNSKSYIVCTIESKDESEIYLIKKEDNNPFLQLLRERQTGITYAIKEFGSQIYMVTNKNAINNKLLVLVDKNSWKEIVPHTKNILITDFLITDNYYVLKTYKNSFLEIKYKRKSESKWKKIDFKTEIFDANFRLNENDKIKIYYSNPKKPFIEYEYDLSKEILTRNLSTKIKRGFNPQYFKTERLWAKSLDGTEIPMTLINSLHPKKKHKGLILKVYGAYGSFPRGNDFNAEDAVLLNDGFTIVYTHTRGGIAMGNEWYTDGKLLKKENCFNDYIACAEYLIERKYTSPQQLIGYGNSAGGLIMGVVINRRPELFNTVILDHPYLDVLSTMMDESLPLTTDEYKEWGNPKEKEVYNYIKGYSPYQNIKKQNYPNLLFTASSNDFQTPVWQVAKYVAKLKNYNTGNNNILFITDFGSGHIGNTSGKEWLKKLSLQYAFIYGNLFD